MLDSSSPSSPTTTNSSGRTKPDPPVRAPRAREQDQKSVSSSEDLHLSSSRGSDLLTSSRGRPDGGEGEEEVSPPAPLDRTSKVRDLRAAWEPKPPVSAKPEPRERRSRKEAGRNIRTARAAAVAEQVERPGWIVWSAVQA